MKLFFATIFDSNYLSRGLALYESLDHFHKNYLLFIVCLDKKVKEVLEIRNLKNVKLLTEKEIEEFYPELEAVKRQRSRTDYIFTLSPFYPSYIFSRNPEIPFICTLDCDQYFFSSSEKIFDQLDNHSVLIMPHRFPEELKHLEFYGKFNVSFQVFKNNKTGIDCLKLWREQCLSKCSDIADENHFADQKYLDTWEGYFGNEILPISNEGLGLAPWNLKSKVITVVSNEILVNDKSLILYHYQGLRFVLPNLINSGLGLYNVKAARGVTKHILTRIVKALNTFQQKGNVDKIKRNAGNLSGSFFNSITGNGFFLNVRGRLINLDRLYNIIKK